MNVLIVLSILLVISTLILPFTSGLWQKLDMAVVYGSGFGLLYIAAYCCIIKRFMKKELDEDDYFNLVMGVIIIATFIVFFFL